MASGGSIVVRIAGDDAQLQAALARSKQGLSQLGSQMRTGVAAAAKYAAALTAVGTALTAALVVKQMKAIDATAKFSDQIGIATKDLTQLQFAAKETANITEQQFSVALRRMTRRIAEAADGAGPAANAIKALGLSAQELKDAGPAEAFRRISDAIANTEVQSERLRHAFALFDTDGSALVNTMADGAAGLDEYARKADALGKSFDRIDAAQVEAANTAIARIGDVISGVGNQLAIQLAPFVEEVAAKMTALAVESGGFGSAIAAAIEAAMRGMGYLGNVMRGVHVSLKGLQLAFQALGTGILQITSMVQEGWERIFELIVTGMGDAIRQVNRLPGINISTEGLDNFAAGLRANADAHVAWRQSMRDSLAQTAQELHELAMQPMPGDQVEAFLEAVKTRSREAAEEIAAARAAMGGGGGEGEAGSDPNAEKEAERHRKEIEDRIERIRQGLLTEREVEIEQYEEKLAWLEEARELEILAEEEHKARVEGVEQAHKERMLAIQENEAQAAKKLEDARNRALLQSRNNFMSNLSGLMNTQSRKLFEVGKAAAVGEAAVKGSQAVMDAWQAGMSIGTPAAPAFAAAYAAAAAINSANLINNIRSQSFGGGGQPAAPTQGSSNVSPQGAGGGATSQAEPESDIVFQLRGQSFGPDAIADIAKGLGDFIGEGGRIRNVRVEQF